MMEVIDGMTAGAGDQSVKVATQIETTSVVVKDNKTKKEKEVKNTEKRTKKYFSGKVCYFNMKLGTTISLPNFQSARIDKGLLIPIGDELDPALIQKIKDTDKWCSDLLSDLIDREAKPIIENRETN